MRFSWAVLLVSLVVSACGVEVEPEPNEVPKRQTTSAQGMTTTVAPPAANNWYDSVFDIRSAIEEGGFVCSAWEVNNDDDDGIWSESASCAGVLVFAVYENGELLAEDRELGHDQANGSGVLTYDLVGANWFVTCEDRQDLCEALQPYLGGEIVVSNPSDG